MPAFFQVPSRSVVSEIIDGEAIILDLRSGLYFSAEAAGAVIWDGMSAGFSAEDIAARLADGFDATPETLRMAIDAFAAELTANELILPTAQAKGTPAGWTMELPVHKVAFVAPTLNIYGDLQDLARLDPIHDVEEEAGWPNRRSQAARA